MFCQNPKSYVNIEYGLDLIICFYECTYNEATFFANKFNKNINV